MSDKKEYHVLNLGAGVQSTTVALLYSHFDVAIFADTQEEPKVVYDHLSWLIDEVAENYPVWVRTEGKLGDDLLAGIDSTGAKFMTIPAHLLGGKGGIGKRECTKQYKSAVVNRTIRRELLGLKPRQRKPKDVTVFEYFGISRDEARRAIRIKDRLGERAKFPLLERGWTRGDCLRFLEDRVPHPVPKSACVFCPYQTNDQWRRLKSSDPDAWNRAVKIDSAIRIGGKYQRFLHPDRKPLEQVDLTNNQMNLGFVRECEGMCGV